jgi:hypothetical protein
MAETAHDRQLGEFVVLFQGLESSLIETISVITDKDYVAEILPTETKYRRLVESTGFIFSRFVDLLPKPDWDAKTRFHELMEKCLDIGMFRDRFTHATYALLVRADDDIEFAQGKTTTIFQHGSRRQDTGEDLSVESFEPYFQKIADVLAELGSFRHQVIEWKYRDGRTINNARKP